MRLVATTSWVAEEPDVRPSTRLFAATRRLLGSLEEPEDTVAVSPVRLVVSNATRSP